MADHAIRSVTVNNVHWAALTDGQSMSNRPPRLRGSKNIAGTLAHAVCCDTGKRWSILAWEDGNHLPILSDEPHIWYIVHYNAPYVGIAFQH